MSCKGIQTTEGTLGPNQGRYVLVVARWNSFVVEHLLEGAIDALRARAQAGEEQP